MSAGAEEMPAHSDLGPSAAERWLVCTKSIEAAEGIPDTESEFAAEGTAAHTLSEWARVQRRQCKEFIGKTIQVGQYSFTVTDSMADYVQQFVDFCEAIPGEAFVEVRVSYSAWVPGGWGTADDITIDEDSGVCYVTDLKYGQGVQKYAKANPQLMLYGLGAYQEFGHLYDFDRLVLTIHQPRLGHVDSWEISVRDLLAWASDTVAPIAQKVIDREDTEFVPGPHCQFCRAKMTCEARAQKMISTYTEDFAEDGGVIEELSNLKLAEYLDVIPEIKKWCADMEAHAFSQLQKGLAVGDYKLVAGRSSRNWAIDDEAELVERMRARLKIRKMDAYVQKLVSPAQLEKLVGKKKARLMAEYVETRPGKPTMVPGSDPRPPLTIDGKDEFDVVEP